MRGAVLALGLLASASAMAQDFTWLNGNWDVAYEDAALGRVRGQAQVRVEVDGWVNIQYRVTDPRNGSVHALSPFNIRQSRDVLTMELPMGGPSGATTAEGAPAPGGAPAVRTLGVPVGAELRATLAEKGHAARVGASTAVANPRLRLVRKGERLEGEWMVQRDSASGFKGARLGARTADGMRGKEVWESAFMSIEDARRQAWNPSAPGAKSTGGTMRLAIRGKNLPNSQERQGEVAFAYEALKPDLAFKQGYAPDSLALPVAIDGDSVPGPKTFTVTDPATTQKGLGEWTFDWPPLSTGKIRHARKSLADHYEPTSGLYLGEEFYLEAEAAPTDAGRYRIYLMESDASDKLFFHMTRDVEAPTKFRAGPFLLLGPDEPAPQHVDEPRPQGPLERVPQIKLDQHTVVRPSVPEPFIVRATVGSRLRSGPATALPGDRPAFAFADISEEEEGEGRYPRALAQAREFRKLHPEQERYVISRFQPAATLREGFSRRTLVTEADHAALILVHDEMSRLVGSVRKLHARELSPVELRAYGAMLTEVLARGGEEPIFAYEVPRPDNSDLIYLNGALHGPNLQQWFGTDQAKRNAYYERVIPIAARKLVSALGTSYARLESVDISRPEELLPIVKGAYPFVAGSLVQTLVRRSRPSQGEPAQPRWVPDEPGRVAVRGVDDLLGAIASDEQLAKEQWKIIASRSAPVVAIGGVAVGLAGMAVAGYAITAFILGTGIGQLTADIGSTRTAFDQRDVARDFTPILGREQYLRADRAAWDQLGDTAVSAGMLAAEVLTLGVMRYARLTSMPPRMLESAVAQAMERGIEGLSPAARANFAQVLATAARKAAGGGAGALTELERRALRANFPSGIPADVARTLKIPAGDPNFVIKPGDSTVKLPAFQTPPSASSVRTPRGAGASEPPQNALFRRLYDDAEATARLGLPEAQGRMERLGRAAGEFEQLPKPAQGRVEAGAGILARLRKENPALAHLDEAEALEYMNFHSRRQDTSAIGGTRAVLPEELAAEFAAFRGGRGANLTGEQLSRAANISIDNAEAALFTARQRLGPKPGQIVPTVPGSPLSGRVTDPSAVTLADAPRPVSSGAVTVMPPSPSARVADPGAVTIREAPGPVSPGSATIDLPGPPTPAPPRAASRAAAVERAVSDDPRHVEIAERLRTMGVRPEAADFGAVVPAGRPVDVRTATAIAAMKEQVPAERLMQQMRMKRGELEPLMDDYLRRFENATDVQRRRVLGQYFGDAPPAGERAASPLAPAQPNAPRGLAGPVVSNQQARSEVEKSLKAMGAGEKEIKALPIDEAIARSGARPQEVAAGLARQADIDARAAARALGKDEKQLAGMLDNYEAGMRPQVPPAERAADIASRLRHDGFTEPYTRLLQARQERIDAGLRDVGIPRGDPALTARGLDPESAIVGQALANGVPAEVVQARRGLTRARLEHHVDDYLANTGAANPAQRTREKTQLLSRPPTEASGKTVRLPPRVIAAEHELADALEGLGVPRASAESRAGKLANLAQGDAHEAIVVGGWQSRVPPAQIRRQFGLTDEQMARRMDHYLDNYVGMGDPAARARYIADNFFGRHGESMSPDAVRRMVSAPATPGPPLRAFTTANPPPAPIPPPPSRPRPLAAQPPGDLTARFGPANPPGMGLRLEERLPGGGVRPNPGVQELLPGRAPQLVPGPKYLWLIDERGRLLVAPERFALDSAGRPILNVDGDPGRLGHASMIDGGRARIAGELRYVQGQWMLDNVSGRYSLLSRDMRFEHLQNAAELLERSGLRVRINYHQPPGQR